MILNNSHFPPHKAPVQILLHPHGKPEVGGRTASTLILVRTFPKTSNPFIFPFFFSLKSIPPRHNFTSKGNRKHAFPWQKSATNCLPLRLALGRSALCRVGTAATESGGPGRGWSWLVRERALSCSARYLLPRQKQQSENPVPKPHHHR